MRRLVRRVHPWWRASARTATVAAAALRRMLGARDHAEYVARLRVRHPEQVPLSADAFDRDVLARRYERPGSRCC